MSEKSEPKLSEKQKEIINYTASNYVEVIAGPGSGKTFTLIKYVEYLITNLKVVPSQILLITFTKKAVIEMKIRLLNLLGKKSEGVNISTIHAFCYNYMRDNLPGLTKFEEFRILDETAQYTFLLQIWEDLFIEFAFKFPNFGDFVNKVAGLFSKLKDRGISPSKLENIVNNKIEKYRKLGPKKYLENQIATIFREKRISEAYNHYCDELKKRKYLDFGDIINRFNEFLKEDKEFLLNLQDTYKYIIVDEFQDTNIAQLELLKLIAKKNVKLLVVGDYNQSIYKFRGANPKNIFDFNKHFKPKIFNLATNFRSTKKIVETANELIKNNSYASKKLSIFYPENEIGPDVYILEEETQEEEAFEIINIIQELKSKNIIQKYSDVAILFRSVNSHAPDYLEIFIKEELPFEIQGNGNLFNNIYIKNIIELLFYIHRTDPFNICEFKLFEFSKGTKEKFIDKKKNNAFFKEFKTGLNRNRRKADKRDYIENYFSNIEELFKKNGITNNNDLLFLKDLFDFKKNYELELLKNKNEGRNMPSTLVIYYKILSMTNFFARCIKEQRNTDLQNLALFSKLISTYQNHLGKSLARFLGYFLKNIPDRSFDEAISEVKDEDKVKIMTIHQAKGLEFPVVFLPNLVKGRFPVEIVDNFLKIEDILEELEDDKGEDEERRLFYVGITRAKSLLIISRSKRIKRRKRENSIFLNEINGKSTKVIANFEDIAYKGIKIKKSAPKETLDLKMISFSKLLYYILCPLRYKLNFVFGFTTPTYSFISYGLSLHHSLAELHYLIKNGETIETIQIQLKTIFDKHWISEGYGSRQKEKEFYKRGLDILFNYLEENKLTLNNIEGIEERFKVRYKDFILIGVIDLIKKTNSNTLELIDFKSGKLMKKNEIEEGKLQLLFYAFTYSLLASSKVDTIKLYSLSSQKYVPETSKEQRFTQELKDKIKQKLDNILENLKKGNYPPNSKNCSRCEYSNLCPVSTSKKANFMEKVESDNELPERFDIQNNILNEKYSFTDYI